MQGYWFNTITNMEGVTPTTGKYGKPHAGYFEYLKGLSGSTIVTPQKDPYVVYDKWVAPDGSVIGGSANMSVYVDYQFMYVEQYNETLRKKYYDELIKKLPKQYNFALYKFNKHYQAQIAGFKGYNRDGIVDLWSDFQPSIQFVPPYLVLGVSTDGYINVSFATGSVPNAGNTIKYKSQSRIFDGFNNEGYSQGGMYGVARVTII